MEGPELQQPLVEGAGALVGDPPVVEEGLQNRPVEEGIHLPEQQPVLPEDQGAEGGLQQGDAEVEGHLIGKPGTSPGEKQLGHV